MIHSTKQTRNHYYVSSDKVHKDASIVRYEMYGGGVKWQIKHVGNGARKNFATYQECIDYLTSKGW